VRAVEHLCDLADHGCASGIRKLGQLLEMLVEQVSRPRRLDWCADEYRTLDGRMKIDGVS